MRNLKDKVVVITGASRGIGAAVARQFAKEKCRLVLCGRDEKRLDDVAGSLELPKDNVITVIGDLVEPETVHNIVETAYTQFERVDVWVNNAGVGEQGMIPDMTDEQFDHVFNVNVKPAFRSFCELIPRFKKQGGGQIINISSLAAKYGGAGMAVYSASKAALNMLSWSVGSGVRNDNIKINVLAPGSVDTGFGGREPRREDDATRTNLLAEEVAEMVVDLAKQNANAWTSHTEIRTLRVKR